MRLTIAHDESVKKSHRVRKAQETKLQSSKDPDRLGARFPYGYSKSDINGVNELVPNENANIVKLIFYLYSFGYSEKKIAKLLGNSKVPTPSNYSIWSDSSIRYILTNPWYVGDFVWFSRTSYSNSKKKPIEEALLFTNHHQPLIEPALWETTQYFRNSKKNKDRMDSPFILRNLVFCSECGEKLKTKNQTSAKSKKDESIYFCPICNCKIRIDIHQTVINDFSLRWGRELKSHQKEFKNTTNKWKKICNNKIKDLTDYIEKLRYKKRLLNQNEDNYDEFLEVINLQLSSTEQDKLLYINVQKKLDSLLEDRITEELIDRFNQDIHLYSNEEIRSILLLSVKKITFNFIRNHLTMEYRLSPYVEIESLMDKNPELKTS